jgi:hypothetical protein
MRAQPIRRGTVGTSEQMQIDTALGLAHFSAGAVAVVVAALHRGQPIDEKAITHLRGLLAKAAETAPAAAQSYFTAIGRTLEGRHYPN